MRIGYFIILLVLSANLYVIADDCWATFVAFLACIRPGGLTSSPTRAVSAWMRESVRNKSLNRTRRQDETIEEEPGIEKDKLPQEKPSLAPDFAKPVDGRPNPIKDLVPLVASFANLAATMRATTTEAPSTEAARTTRARATIAPFRANN